jgi:hypothetical protein
MTGSSGQAETHHQTRGKRRSPIRGCLLRESAVAPQRITDQGLEYRTAVLSGKQAETVKSPQHQAKIVRHPAWHHPRRLALETREVIAAVANFSSQHGGPDRGYLGPGQRVGTDELDCRARQRMGRPLPAQQLRHGGICDVADIDHCDPHATDGHR